MGWDGMGWDGMGWDGMGWDGIVVRVDVDIYLLLVIYYDIVVDDDYFILVYLGLWSVMVFSVLYCVIEYLLICIVN
jgi:hypothetical protein